MRWGLTLVAAAWLLAAASAGAEPVYKCGGKGRVTYSGVPCAGARVIGAAAPHRTNTWRVPPQDRATIARRAPLTPETRQECRALDATLRDQEAMVKARGEAVTLPEEMPLVQSKKRYRELKC
jgi:hypothetical protein